MEKKRFNWILIISSIIFTILVIYLASIWRRPSVFPQLIPIGVFAGIFGLLNFTKWSIWIKLVLTFIFGVIFMYAGFIIMIAIYGH
tara:strand:+ start:67 stop:324 length:258 start_codon:yes stop_codon:yes gene_type:complete